MLNIIKHKFTFIVTAFAVTMFFSCENNLSELQKLNLQEKFPVGEAVNFKLTYTDSTRVKAILTSPLNYDYSNQEFGYSEFPNGLHIDFFDDNQNKTTVDANYGILYNDTNLVELQDSVVIKTHEGKILKTNKLFWDQKDEWIYTDEAFQFTDPVEGTVMNGVGMDFNRDFTIVNAHETTGVMYLNGEEK
ncbi:LPS export ABC transporter protein LptC [Pustulibacterium marinum]|uniref:LPS export ABC transporter protein LptC n=1 Tax=Pustulibacterium marinum TaxID=1224947 RepID=A0A1I7EUZ2_9FLAO|nr:LPS export ABC transporter periplasmic protein LptC [Pustulibacterium marinum]SFU27713.1 LPS export ABC transporter protein LptC [Pustulibacterium marinum]